MPIVVQSPGPVTIATPGPQGPPGPSGTGGSPWISIRDHGAVGDGSTNDSAAFNAAYTAAAVGGTIWFPPGSYRFASALTSIAKSLRILLDPAVTVTFAMADPGTGHGAIDIAADDVVIEGNGWSSLFTQPDSNYAQSFGDSTAIQAAFMVLSGYRRVAFKNFKIDWQDETIYYPGGTTKYFTAIRAHDAFDLYFDNLYITRGGNRALDIRNCIRGAIRNCFFYNSGYVFGVGLRTSAGVTTPGAGTAGNIISVDVGSGALTIPSDWTCEGCTFQHWGDSACAFPSSARVTIQGNTLIGPHASGLSSHPNEAGIVTGGSTDCTVVGNVIVGVYSHAIYGGDQYYADATATGAMTTGSAVLTVTAATFSAGDVGKYLSVQGAGAGGTFGTLLQTTIAGYTSPTQVTLAATAVHTVSGAGVSIGSTWVLPSRRQSVIGNTIRNLNGSRGFIYFHGTGGAGQDAPIDVASYGITISNNVIDWGNYTGIETFPIFAYGYLLRDVTISGNVIGADAVSAGQVAIALGTLGPDVSTVTGNVVRNFDFGVQTSVGDGTGTVAGKIIAHNQFIGCTTPISYVGTGGLLKDNLPTTAQTSPGNPRFLLKSTTLTFGTIAAHTQALGYEGGTLDVNVPGAVYGDFSACSPIDLPSATAGVYGLIWFCYCVSANTVRVLMHNGTASSIVTNNVAWRIVVMKF